MFDRGPPEAPVQVAAWDDGVSWLAHPDEGGKRVSHALRGADGVWILDPVDATNVDELLSPLGDVVGVAVLSSWHTRDAVVFADRYDVDVYVPEWMDRVGKRVGSQVARYTLSPGESGFTMVPCRPFPLWKEVFLYDDASETLVVPDSMGTSEAYVVNDERLGLQLARRLQPPIQLRGLEPERILVGHGSPVTADAPLALERALADGRGTFLTALDENGSLAIRSMLSAIH